MSENAGKKSAHEKKLAKLKAKRADELNDFYYVANDPRGRRVLLRYIDEICGIYKTTFDPNPAIAAHLEGERKIGCLLLADLREAFPQAELLMLEEQRKEKRNDDSSSASSSAPGDAPDPADD